MKGLVLSSSIAVAMLTASAAMAANINGSASLTGTVTDRCLVSGSGSGSFDGTIPLGTLNGVGGTVNSSLTGNSISGASLSFTLICNTLTPHVTLSATTMGDGVTPSPGYTSLVDYTADVTLAQAGGGKQSFSYVTHGSPAATTGSLSAPLAGTSDNVTVSVNSLNTDGGANTSILTSGNYGSANGGVGGVISITIAP